MNPKISIITITYNSEKTLEETIQSVISQDYDNLEYLIIDGGSKDHTLDIVNKYRDKISYFVSEPDKGISDAFNKGIKAATGEIIGIINSDDILLPKTLRTIVNNYTPGIDVYSCNVVLWDDMNNKYYHDKKTPTTDFHNIYQYHNVAHPGRFISRAAYNKMGVYNIDLRYLMDHDLLVRFFKLGAVFKYINHDAALFRIGGATDQNIHKMKHDYYLYVMNNGGNTLKFHMYWAYKILRYYTKKYLVGLVGYERFRSITK